MFWKDSLYITIKLGMYSILSCYIYAQIGSKRSHIYRTVEVIVENIIPVIF
jgi:hypothetical protein